MQTTTTDNDALSSVLCFICSAKGLRGQYSLQEINPYLSAVQMTTTTDNYVLSSVLFFICSPEACTYWRRWHRLMTVVVKIMLGLVIKVPPLS